MSPIDGGWVVGALLLVLAFISLCTWYLGRHRHSWRIIGARLMELVRPPLCGEWTVGKLPGEPVTEVLSRCATCNAVKTNTLAGKWSLEELTR